VIANKHKCADSLLRGGRGLRGEAVLSPVQVITVTSGKGGVGKTVVSANLSLALAEAGRRVMLMDADLALANVDVVLGLQPESNLLHVIDGYRSLAEIIIEGPGGVLVVPAASGVKRLAELDTVQSAGLIRAFSELVHPVDTLIVDTADGINESVTSFSRAAQEIVVVVCDEPTSIADACALIEVLSSGSDIRRFRVLANQVHSAQEGRELFNKILRASDRCPDVTLEFLGTVPHDEFLRKAVRRQRAVVQAYPRSRSSAAFRNLARKILRWPMPSAATGHLEFFVERLVQSRAGNMEIPV
jgi:flagellar biosynthesis protein FlhG